MKFFITTAIGYINAPPHIGHALEYVQADVVARYRRLVGDQVFFLTGTDEHGSKAFETAKKQKLTPKKLADYNAKKFQELDKSLEVSYDFFIRTTDEKIHWPGVAKLWQKFAESGDIYKDKYQGPYCVGCEAFLTTKELVAGICPIHDIEPEILAEENYFFKLSKYSQKIYQIVKEEQIKIIPAARKNEVLQAVKNGLKDISFSRPVEKLPWGIPVPGNNSQVIYVWGDALTNYLTGVGFGREEAQFAKFWPADIHFIGKDILKFHAIYWPAMLLSAGLLLPKTIFVHGFITSGGMKMSKSLGNVIDPFKVIKKAGPDGLRFYLLSQISPNDDGDFTFEHFENVYNGQLANGLGNLVSRVASLCQSSGFEFVTPKPETAAGQLFRKNKIGKLLDEFKFNQALDFIWGKISEADQLINREKPWEKIKAKRKKRKEKDTLQNLVDRLREIASLLSPFMPETSVTIQKQFMGPKIKSEKPLFPRL